MAAFLRRYYAGGGISSTLASPMGSGDTLFALAAATGWPGATPGAVFGVVIDRGNPTSEEKIVCASNSGTVVTVSASGRGADGTTATSHNAGAPVSLVWMAIDADEANQVTHLLGNGTAGALLSGGGAATLPSWVAAAGDVTGAPGSLVVGKINGTVLGTLSGATNGQVLQYNGSAWVPASGIPPGGSASGDLSGSFPGPTVAKVHGVAISSAQASALATLASLAPSAYFTPANPGSVGGGGSGAVFGLGSTLQYTAASSGNVEIIIAGTAGTTVAAAAMQLTAFLSTVASGVPSNGSALPGGGATFAQTINLQSASSGNAYAPFTIVGKVYITPGTPVYFDLLGFCSSQRPNVISVMCLIREVP